MIEPLVAGLCPQSHERPYWAALQERRLVVQICTACGRRQHYPRSLCTSCLSDALEFSDSSGRGSIYTYTVVHRAPLPELRPLTPYVLALVDLDDGVRIVSNVLGEPAGIHIGDRVTVDFLDVTEKITLPVFRLLSEPG